MSNVVVLASREVSRADADKPGTGSNGRMSVSEIAQRLNIGRQGVYRMLEQRIIPGIRLGRRWLITRHAFGQWERTCGIRTPASPRTISGDFTSIPDRGRSLLCQ